MTLHSIMIFRSRKDAEKYVVVPSTISGPDPYEVASRKESGMEVYIRSWADDWQFVYGKDKTEPEGWSINLNCRDFEFTLEDDSVFNRPVNFEALAKAIQHPLLEFFLN